MEKNILNEEKLKKGEIDSLGYKEVFKELFLDDEHLEILTLLVSKITKFNYHDLFGNITIIPTPKDRDEFLELVSDKNVSLCVDLSQTDNITLIVNLKFSWYQELIDKTSYDILNNYDSKNNDDITIVVNFNDYSEKVFDEYLLRNSRGHILTLKKKILKINVLECFNLWKDKKYLGNCEEDLILLSALLSVNNESDFLSILDQIQMDVVIKDLLKEKFLKLSNNLSSNNK